MRVFEVGCQFDVGELIYECFTSDRAKHSLYFGLEAFDELAGALLILGDLWINVGRRARRLEYFLVRCHGEDV